MSFKAIRNILSICLLFSSTRIIGQEILVSGKATDADGEPLVGANILEKGTDNGTFTDYNGNYEIYVAIDAVLVISYIGYSEHEITVSTSERLNFILEERAEPLDEVVIWGFPGIVGMARKRVESIQHVPESVTALNSEGIERAGINNVSDFVELVPNMKLSEPQAVGITLLIVRGIPQIRNADASVAFVVDGVTIPDPALINQEIFDLALTEAVKGPQGALYGKNAIGGAINIFSKEPTNEPTYSIKLGAGNGGAYSGQFISSGAITKNKTYYRLSAMYQNFNGLLTNEFLDRKVDFSKDVNLRGQIMLTPSSRVKATATLQYMNTDAGATYYSINPSSVGTGGLLQPIDPNPEDGNNVIYHDQFGESDMENIFGNLNLQVNLGKSKLQSITSFNKVDRNTIGDLDFTEEEESASGFGLTQGEFNNTKSFNQEIRLSNTLSDSKIDWSTGGFVQRVERDFFQSDVTLSDELAVTDYTVTFNTIALFGFLDYQLTDQLTASFGLRYDSDNYDQDDRLGGVMHERSDDVLQPKVSLSFAATADVLLYANFGRGYRAGGFNPQITDFFNLDFKKEISDNYELGVKSSIWGDRLILNGSVFYSDFRDRQQYILTTDLFIPGNYNYDKSTILGFEIETKSRLSKNLDLLFSYGFVDSKVDQGGFTGGADGMANNLNEFNGNITSFVPRSNFNLGLASNIRLSEAVSLDMNVNLNGTGKIYWSDLNDDASTSNSYQLLNARATFNINNIKITFWGKNILGEQYYLELYPFGIAWRGRPATAGVTVGLDF